MLPRLDAASKAQVSSSTGHFCSSLGISADSIEFVLDPLEAHPYPSVLSNGSRRVIVLTAGFLKLLETEPSVANEMVEHEIAHLDQADQQLWGHTAFIRYLTSRFFAPFFCFLSVVCALGFYGDKHAPQIEGAGHFADPTPMLTGLCLLCLTLLVERETSECRIRSEKLADTAVALYGGGLGLGAALERIARGFSNRNKKIPYELAERQMHLAIVLRDLGSADPIPISQRRRHIGRRVVRGFVTFSLTLISLLAVLAFLFP